MTYLIITIRKLRERKWRLNKRAIGILALSCRDDEKQRNGKHRYVLARKIITLTLINMLSKQSN